MKRLQRALLALAALGALSIAVVSSSPSTAANVWSNASAGQNREPEIAVDSNQTPTSAGVCFWRNNTFNRCDPTPNPYQMYPPMTLRNNDTLRAQWTGVNGCSYTSTKRVNGSETTTFTCPPTTTASTTTSTTTTFPPTTTTQPPGARFNTLPVGAVLPSGASCATQVRSMTENRPQNAPYNNTVGTSPHNENPRVTGDFTGTTDEILQWAACKWGIDEDWLRAQIVTESWWDQRTVGDTGNECTSHGVGQVRRCYHDPAFEDENAVNSTAYNADYTYGVWRSCFNGEMTWLNTVERGQDYAAGDLLGCMGVWFSGRWYTDPAVNYMNVVQGHFNARTWTTANFGPAVPDGGTPTTTTTVPATTVAPTTTTAPTTTAAPPTTTTPPSGGAFVETFDNNTGLSRFEYGVYHRGVGYREASQDEPFFGVDNNAVAWGQWSADHDLACGDAHTQRTLRSDGDSDTTGQWGWRPLLNFHTDDLLYVCRDHVMSSMGDIAPFTVLWFSPAQVFADVDSVAFDVNLTDLGSRKWWKVGVVSDSLFHTSYGTDWNGAVVVPSFVVSDVTSSGLNSSLQGSDRLIATWSGDASAGRARMKIGNDQTGVLSNPSPNDKMTRHPVSLVDNGNGTVTFTVAGVSVTRAGAFPACPCRVVFYDQNYTPDKDGVPIGHTWHWDNIAVT